jgi:hypothetical protein
MHVTDVHMKENPLLALAMNVFLLIKHGENMLVLNNVHEISFFHLFDFAIHSKNSKNSFSK